MRFVRRIATLGLLLVIPAVAAAQDNRRERLHEKLRELWDDHALWSRLLTVSIVGGLEDRQATMNRVMENQTNIGDAFVPYYGRDDGAKLTALLKEHMELEAALVDSAKAGKNIAADSINRRWHANGEALVMFFYYANPKQWPVETMRLMMATHLQQTYNQAKHRIAGQYSADVKDFDGIQSHILKMADFLAEGIIQQFPQRFYAMVAKK
jgi:hypothetical protein